VRAALRADARRLDAGRLRAAARAKRDSALRDTVRCGSRFSARRTARERRAEGCFARRRVVLLFFRADFPFAGIRTPARRAFDKPMAIACFVLRAPCFPSRTWWISSRTNSPACVDGDLPSALSRRARSSVSFSGIAHLTLQSECGQQHLLCHTRRRSASAGDSKHAAVQRLRRESTALRARSNSITTRREKTRAARAKVTVTSARRIRFLFWIACEIAR
jgi:hypothetical protein